MCKRNVILASCMLLAAMFGFSSCTKSTLDIYEKSVSKAVPVNETDFVETAEDLVKVDYKEYYDQLAPHGEWVQVSADELGIDLKNGESAGESGSILDDLIGVKTAQAYDFGFGMFFVWRPSPNLAISIAAGEPPVYVPYVNGRWVYTDAGWYFRAPTPYEEITCHYGRWVWHPAMGWVWIPGRVWAPAWVEWRESANYIAWAPLHPSVYIVNNVICPVVFHEERYIVVEKRYFCEPDFYRHSYRYKDFKDRIIIKEMRRPHGVMVENRHVINRGPDVFDVENNYGKKIDRLSVYNAAGDKYVKHSDKSFSVFSQQNENYKNTGRKNESYSNRDKVDTKNSVDNKYNGKNEKNISRKEKSKDKFFGERTKGSDNTNKVYKQDGKSDKRFRNEKNVKNNEKNMKNNEKVKDFKEKKNVKRNNEFKENGNDRKNRQDNSTDRKNRQDKGNDKKYKQDKVKDKSGSSEQYKQTGKENKKVYRQKESDKINKTDKNRNENDSKGNERNEKRSSDKTGKKNKK